MCFSAESSFIAAGTLGAAGVAVSRQVSANDAQNNRLLALVPWLFACHQLTEGMLWLGHGGISPFDGYKQVLEYVFACIAFCLWPAYFPYAIYLGEDSAKPLWQRIGYRLLIPFGIGVSAYFGYFLFARPMQSVIVRGCMRYTVLYDHVLYANMGYGGAVFGSFALSRRSWIILFGAALFCLYLIAFYRYRYAYPSVWCYFAALLSIMLWAGLRYRST